MKIVEQSHQIIDCIDADHFAYECKLIEQAGRTCYKSEDKINVDAGTWKPFVKMLIERGHEAMIEFGHMTVRFVCDRGVSHEIVRHRLCSFAQESTRYCNYGKDKFGGEVTFIAPRIVHNDGIDEWRYAYEAAEQAYLKAIKAGHSPQEARAVLPNAVKTEIVVKANFREWRHIFSLRAVSKAAHPHMRELMLPLYKQCREICPQIFDLGEPE